jgi:hypothetical protein
MHCEDVGSCEVSVKGSAKSLTVEPPQIRISGVKLFSADSGRRTWPAENGELAWRGIE